MHAAMNKRMAEKPFPRTITGSTGPNLAPPTPSQERNATMRQNTCPSMYIGPTERTAVEDNQAAKEKNGQTMWTKKGFWNLPKFPSQEGRLQRKTWLLKTCCEAQHVRIVWVFQLLPTHKHPQQRESFALHENMARTNMPKQVFRNDAEFCFQNALLQRKKWRFETCTGGYHTQEEKNADFVNLLYKPSLQHNPGNSNLLRYIFRFMYRERNEGKHPRQGERFPIP
jgi:hypothetical protein